MGFANKAFVAGGLGLAVSALVGCGSSGGLLSATQASNLNKQLDLVESAVAHRDCSGVDTAIASLNRSIASLGSVNGTLVSNLQTGVQTVAQLADLNCEGIFDTSTTSSASTSSIPTTSSSRSSSTTTTTSTTTSTTKTSTSSSTTSTSTTTKPPTSTSTSTSSSTFTSSSTSAIIPPSTTPTATNPSGGAGLTGSGATGGGSSGGGGVGSGG